MPKLFDFYKNLIKINNVDFIEEKLEENFINDYFKRNSQSNQLILHRSFCFSLNDIFVLINNIKEFI
jgi:hypothetical protein